MKDTQNDTARLAASKEILFMAGLSRELKTGPVTIEEVKRQRAYDETIDYL